MLVNELNCWYSLKTSDLNSFCTFVPQFQGDTPPGTTSDSSEGEEDEEEESEPALDATLETEGRREWCMSMLVGMAMINLFHTVPGSACS